MVEAVGSSSRRRRWLARVVTTLAAWSVAFLVVMALLTIFGEELESLPLALRALMISGVLVALMANLVMPVLSAIVTRWMPVPLPPCPPAGPLSTRCGDEESRV